MLHTVREPMLDTARIEDLRPTQITVGYREVNAKRHAWRGRGDKAEKAAKFLARHLVPVIRGPDAKLYVIDHHHLARALQDEGQDTVAVAVTADLSHLQKESFWFVLDNRGWMHPFDADGKRRDRQDLPKRIADLVDDPYRSLAGELRMQGGYAKDTTPFSEFIWADFLRHRVKRRHIEDDFDAALAEALQLAKSSEADYLPGWCGPVARQVSDD